MRARLVIAVLMLLSAAVPLFAGDPFPEKKYPNVVIPRVQFGSYGEGLGRMKEASAIAVTPTELYVAECFNRRIQIFDLNGRALRAFYGRTPDELTCPQGIALDRNRIFVADRRNRVVVYDRHGTYQYAFGSTGDGLGKLNDPGSLAFANGRLYVNDAGNSRIQVFTREGKPLYTIGERGAGDGQFYLPRALTVDDHGNVYVVDMMHRVQKFDAHGRFVKTWGRYGGMAGELAEPNDIAWVNGKLYVADLVNHRLQVFDTEGKFLMQWGRHPEIHHEGMGRTHYPTSLKVSPDDRTAVVCEQFEYRCQIFDVAKIVNLPKVDVTAWWEKFPQFHYGGGARIARRVRGDAVKAKMSGKVLKTFAHPEQPRDILIMTEPDIHKVVALAIDGADHLETVYSVGQFGKGPLKWGMLSAKKDLRAGDLLIGDAGNHVIQRLDLLTGEYKATYFGPGKGPGQFNGPSGIDEAPNGDIYIGDFHNDRIQVFNSKLEYQFEFGGTGSARGKLFGPLSIAFNPTAEILYVTDSGNQRIQAFDRKGSFLFEFGRLTRPGEWGNGTFQWPFDIAVSPTGELYVTDPSLQMVQKFTTKGEFITQWGGWGTQPGQFYKPKGIDVDSDGRVYVIDFGNHRGQVFDPNGKFLAFFGEGIMYPAGVQPKPANQ